jgi:uncharacterized protein (DUF1697 family)
MAEVKGCLREAGFDDVETYLHTGNVRVGWPLESSEEVAGLLEGVFAKRTGFEVPTIVLTPTELSEVYAAATGLDPPAATATRRYVTFLKEPLAGAAAAALDEWSVPGEGARVQGRAVHWWIDHPTRNATLSNVRIERAGAVGTTRDLKVVAALAQRWGVPGAP